MSNIGKPVAEVAGRIGSVVSFRPGSPVNRLVRRQVDIAARHMRHLSGQLEGVSYRLAGGHPDPDVADDVLADRVRSTLGGTTKRLDLPRTHVAVRDRVAILHGDVGSRGDAEEIERVAAAVSGIEDVESHLHVGLGPSDTRPSTGRATGAPSDAHRTLVRAATAAGIDEDVAPTVVRSVLARFAGRLPSGERDQVAAHLPADVRAMFAPPRRAAEPARLRTTAELVAAIAADTVELPPRRAESVVAAVVRALRELVPEEVGDVAANLPPDLRAFWLGDSPAGAMAAGGGR